MQMSCTRFCKRILFKYVNCQLFHVNVREVYVLKKSVRLVRRTMNVLAPPEEIRGLKTLDRRLFRKEINVAALELGNVVISKVMPVLKKYLLKMENLKPIQLRERNEVDEKENPDKYVLLSPVYVRKWCDIVASDRETLDCMGVSKECFKMVELTLGYEHWRADELLRAILPEDQQSVAGFSKIGHIIHLNLREHLLDYKKIIGQILLEKVAGVRTVVNKLDKIDSKYRNFEMEIICGDNDMFVHVKENHCKFEFDFSQVYWNPRLATEHERIVRQLNAGDVLYDVFAGVGPFAIPAARKKCIVLANDLNPESFNWLNHNGRVNNIGGAYMKTFNKDGREFVHTDLKMDLLTRLQNKLGTTDIHITMNLPALAPQFLYTFVGLLSASDLQPDQVDKYPIVHVYCFAKGERPVQIARDLIECNLGQSLHDNLIEIFNVRKVSSNKEMMRLKMGRKKPKQQKTKNIFKVAGAKSLKIKQKAKAVVNTQLKKVSSKITKTKVEDSNKQLQQLQETVRQSAKRVTKKEINTRKDVQQAEQETKKLQNTSKKNTDDLESMKMT